MGILRDLVQSLENTKKKSNEDIIKEIEKKGALDSEEIAKSLGQYKEKPFVPKADVPPVDLEDCYIDEFGQINRKPKEENNKNNVKEDEGR